MCHPAAADRPRLPTSTSDCLLFRLSPMRPPRLLTSRQRSTKLQVRSPSGRTKPVPSKRLAAGSSPAGGAQSETSGPSFRGGPFRAPPPPGPRDAPSPRRRSRNAAPPGRAVPTSGIGGHRPPRRRRPRQRRRTEFPFEAFAPHRAKDGRCGERHMVRTGPSISSGSKASYQERVTRRRGIAVAVPPGGIRRPSPGARNRRNRRERAGPAPRPGTRRLPPGLSYGIRGSAERGPRVPRRPGPGPAPTGWTTHRRGGRSGPPTGTGGGAPCVTGPAAAGAAGHARAAPSGPVRPGSASTRCGRRTGRLPPPRGGTRT